MSLHVSPDRFLPPGAVIEFAPVRRPHGELYPAEERSVRGAVPSRRLEFLAGRECARRALAKIGVPPGPIPVGAGREPLWPAGVLGSITHDREWCLAVVARSGELRAVGIDIEEDVPLEAALLDPVLSPAETEAFRALPAPAPCGWPKFLFAVKEAVFKCLYPRVGRFFEFDAVELEPYGDGSALRISRSRVPGIPENEVRSLQIRIATLPGHVLAACWLPGDGSAAADPAAAQFAAS